MRNRIGTEEKRREEKRREEKRREEKRREEKRREEKRTWFNGTERMEEKPISLSFFSLFSDQML